jgi:hypothetical protein
VLLRRYVQSANTEPAENEKEFASAYHQKADISNGAVRGRKIRRCGEAVFNDAANETYNRSKVRSVCNGDAQGLSRFSCVDA